MNSKQRRKFKREFPFEGIIYNMSFDVWDEVLIWCNNQFGKKNWSRTGYWGTIFKFKKEKDLTWFLMKWS